MAQLMITLAWVPVSSSGMSEDWAKAELMGDDVGAPTRRGTTPLFE